jgi:hypothetical protein
MLLLYEPKSDAAALSWGAWTAGLPRANLTNDQLSRVARTLNTDLTSTRFRVALSVEESFRALVLAGLNVTPGYKYRIRSYTAANFTTVVYDSGWVQPFTGSSGEALELEWEDPWFWLGIVPFDDPDRGVSLIHVFDTVTSGQYWSFELDDQYNPAGYVEAARLFMPAAWAPSINYDYSGNGFGLGNNVLSAASLSGSKSYWRRINPRLFRFAIPTLPEAEAFGAAYRLMQRAGFDGEVFVIPDPDDIVNIQKRSFLGTITEMDLLTQAMFGRAGAGFQIEERI